MGNYVPQTIGEFVFAFIILTVGAMGRQLVDGLIALVTGKQAEERTLLAQYQKDTRDAREEAAAARRDRDVADSKRRKVAEHASALRYHLLSLGVRSSDIEPYPYAPPTSGSSASEPRELMPPDDET